MTKQTIDGAQNIELMLNKYEFKYSNKCNASPTNETVPSKYKLKWPKQI